MKQKLFVLIGLFLINCLCFSQIKTEFRPISEMNSDEKEMYDILQKSVSALLNNKPNVKLFPVFKTFENEQEFLFSSMIYDETSYNSWDKIAHSATYTVELHFTKRIELKLDPNVKYYSGSPYTLEEREERKKSSEFYLAVGYSKSSFSFQDQTLVSLKRNKPYFDNKYSKVSFVKSMRNNYVNSAIYDIEKTSSIAFINNDIAIYIKNGLYGIVNNKNKIIVPFQYNSLRMYPVGILAQEKDSYFFIDLKGSKISKVYDKVDMIFCSLFPQINDYFKAKVGDKFTLVSPTFEEKLPLIYDDILPFYDTEKSATKLLLSRNQKKVIFDLETWQETNLIFDNIKVISRKLMFVEKDKKCGIVTTNGTPILNLEYDAITYLSGYFEAVLFAIKKDGKTALYSDNQFITNFEYDSLVTFMSYIKAEKNHKFGLLSQKSEVVLPLEYDSIEFNKKTNKIEATKNTTMEYFDFKALIKK